MSCTQKFKFELYESYFLRVATRKSVDTEDDLKEGVQYRRIGLTDIRLIVSNLSISKVKVKFAL